MLALVAWLYPTMVLDLSDRARKRFDQTPLATA